MGGRSKQPGQVIGKHRKKLLYRVSPANGGLVFAEPARVDLVSRLCDAWFNSTTWGEFRHKMPRAEYSELLHGGCFDEYRRKSEELFPQDLWLQLDRPYPWLQQEMVDLIPPDILDHFAEPTDCNPGCEPYPHVDPRHLLEMIALLEQRGFIIEDGSHFFFD